MSTLYQRMTNFYAHDSFRFKAQKKKEIGKRLNAIWTTTHTGETPPKVESVEDSGTYQVFNYPDDFTTIIDQLIRNIHQEVLLKSREWRRSQYYSQLSETPPDGAQSCPTPAPQKKERKRIPVKQQPAWKPR